MYRRLRATSLASGGALALVLVVSGMVAAASILTAIAAPVPDGQETEVVDTTATFEDLDGNNVDDDCQDAVLADETAAAAAEAAADLNGDGTISVSEAAQSGRVGGKNCNHGGYVSSVAHGTCDAATTDTTDGTDATEGDATNADEAEADADAADESDAEDANEDDATDASTSDCETTDATDATTTEDTAAECDATAPTDEESSTDGTETTDPEAQDETTDTVPTSHGQVVRDVAKSDAVGGKNCNHGGAVSEASHKDNEARKAEREAAKAAREAAREAAKAAREAAKGTHGKGHGHNH
jgi:hypothetical protein